jgi:hypothetical protein
VDERVAAQAIPLKKEEEVDIDEWRRFLDNVKPADFKRSLH